jgi:hypothetical protein
MENPNLIIRIPEPCNEDWNNMQPDAKGRFCGSCSKSVHDFTNKTDTEIRDILIEYKDQKVCGHFKKTQIDRPLNIRSNLKDLPKNVSVAKAFATAVFLVFGTLLFSCTNAKDQKIGEIEVTNTAREPHLQGEMTVPPIEMLRGDTVMQENTLKNVTICEQNYVSGGIGVEIVSPIEELKTGEVQVIEDSVRGKMKLVTVEPGDSAVMITADTTLTTDLRKMEDQPINKQVYFSVYPNPGNGEFTVSYNVLKRADVRVDIYDLRGVLIKTVVNVPGQYEGKYQIPVNLSELPNGIYMVSLINNGKRNTGKLVIEK